MTKDELISEAKNIVINHTGTSMDDFDTTASELTMIFDKAFNYGLICTPVKVFMRKSGIDFIRMDTGQILLILEDIMSDINAGGKPYFEKMTWMGGLS